ncbi:unnamed protein product [Aureobasidium vineae]|uniref:RRM domain-containing protein n=1 Tax=Aureobasidium vineae TaxID=2773715 RepID=A0A9N8JHW7_9PEZI|nr:unnamed protein product [Aureobasidium vineae]
MSLLENDSGDDGEVRHKRFDYPAPSLAGIIDFFTQDGVTDKHIRCYLRAPCPWTAPDELTNDDGKILCRKDEHPLGWMMPVGKQGELFRHLVVPPVAKLYPDLFAEPDLETQIRQDQPNTYGRFKYAPFVVCREVLVRMIESCAQEMRTIPCLRIVETESQHVSPRPQLKRCRLEGFETDDADEQPDLKKEKVKPFEFTPVKAVVMRPDLPKVLKSEVAASENDTSKPAKEDSSRGQTVTELIAEERALRDRLRNAPTSPASSTKKRQNSTTSYSSSEHNPTRARRDDIDRPVVERRRLHIRNMGSWTKRETWYLIKLPIQADFFERHRVGAITITIPVGSTRGKSGFADFSTHEQAKRAMEDLDRTPLLGRVVDIEIAQPSTPVEEEEKHPLPVKSNARLPSSRRRL